MGEIADEMIERMIWGHLEGDPWDEEEPKTLQDFAEEKADAVKRDKKTKDLNKGIIEW